MVMRSIQNNGTGIPLTTTAPDSNRKKTEEVKYKFRVQSAPPLSLSQFVRASTGILNVVEDTWKPSGRFRPSKFTGYMPPRSRTPPQLIEVKPWMPPGQPKYIRPSSIGSERRPKTVEKELLWMPPGQPKYIQPSSIGSERRPKPVQKELVWMPSSKKIRYDPPPILRSEPNFRPIRDPEPKWMPAGKPKYKPVPYFDPPALRWSLQLLMSSESDINQNRTRTKFRSKTIEGANINSTTEVSPNH
ncbi:unnamed protein product [Didymodactylos carnosus]|uniref:Uncharacterized protein n=1 Tax=Didymodactylos carnosus TaxID=1234261 RepID=A0A813NFE7_9BILA|nr:unnamed protein product [Didymodactylos carnosus]CAF1182190.1 unnamed protein product [Didymodactylos carnosus]CAF3516787.1 unnamed protein product [Didymodactylos carnosus]CAF3993412.1 unnamed protein product [Didymodactylos carnosus]